MDDGLLGVFCTLGISRFDRIREFRVPKIRSKQSDHIRCSSVKSWKLFDNIKFSTTNVLHVSAIAHYYNTYSTYGICRKKFLRPLCGSRKKVAVRKGLSRASCRYYFAVPLCRQWRPNVCRRRHGRIPRPESRNRVYTATLINGREGRGPRSLDLIVIILFFKYGTPGLWCSYIGRSVGRATKKPRPHDNNNTLTEQQ